MTFITSWRVTRANNAFQRTRSKQRASERGRSATRRGCMANGASRTVTPMRLCAAQLLPETGNVGRNVLKHVALIDVAVSRHADLIFFPELSLTGYEPKLVRDLACDDFVSAGRTAIWNRSGELVASMDGEGEGLVMFDTSIQEGSVVLI